MSTQYADQASISQALQDSLRLTRPALWDRLSDVERHGLTHIADLMTAVLTETDDRPQVWEGIQRVLRLIGAADLPAPVEVRNGDEYFTPGSLPEGWVEATAENMLPPGTRVDVMSISGDIDYELMIGHFDYSNIAAYRVIAPQQPSRPAWPGDKAYRWMAQDRDGAWCAYTEKPITGPTREWQCGWAADFVRLTGKTVNNPNWRDTLVERGADE